jgi:hypothetical protein
MSPPSERAMYDVNEYGARAERCRRKAQQARDETDKRAWLELAEDWSRLIRQRVRSGSTATERFAAKESE